MIYIHTYGVGKFGKEVHRTVHETKESAKASQDVLGGEVKAYCEADESVDVTEVEFMRELIDSEVSELIDNMTCHGPGGPWEDPGSPEWDCAKVNTINKINRIIDGAYSDANHNDG